MKSLLVLLLLPVLSIAAQAQEPANVPVGISVGALLQNDAPGMAAYSVNFGTPSFLGINGDVWLTYAERGSEEFNLVRVFASRKVAELPFNFEAQLAGGLWYRLREGGDQSWPAVAGSIGWMKYGMSIGIRTELAPVTGPGDMYLVAGEFKILL